MRVKRLLATVLLAGSVGACTYTMFRHDTYSNVTVKQTVDGVTVKRRVQVSWIRVGDDAVDLTASALPGRTRGPVPPAFDAATAQEAVEELLPDICGGSEFHSARAPVGFPGGDYAFRYNCARP